MSYRLPLLIHRCGGVLSYKHYRTTCDVIVSSLQKTYFRFPNFTMPFSFLPFSLTALVLGSAAVTPATLVGAFSPSRSHVPQVKLGRNIPARGGDRVSPTALTALLDPAIASTIATAAAQLSPATEPLFTNGDIATAFSVATFAPQPFWLFLIFAPKVGITKKLFGGMGTS